MTFAITLAVVLTVVFIFLKVLDAHGKKLILTGLWFWAVFMAVQEIVPPLLEETLPNKYADVAVWRFVDAITPAWILFIVLGTIHIIVDLLCKFVFNLKAPVENERVVCKGIFNNPMETVSSWVVRLGTLGAIIAAVIPRVQWVVDSISSWTTVNSKDFDARYIYNVVAVLPEILNITLTVFAVLSVIALFVTTIFAKQCVVTTSRVLTKPNLFKTIEIPRETITSVAEDEAHNVILSVQENTFVFARLKNYENILRALGYNPFAAQPQEDTESVENEAVEQEQAKEEMTEQ